MYIFVSVKSELYKIKGYFCAILIKYTADCCAYTWVSSNNSKIILLTPCCREREIIHTSNLCIVIRFSLSVNVLWPEL